MDLLGLPLNQPSTGDVAGYLTCCFESESSAMLIHLRPVADEDKEFLFRVYASTRQEEIAATGWNILEIEGFLRMQFELQHKQYMRNYPAASFNIILIDGTPAGRLYVDRRENEIRLIDIALLPEFRGKGAGGRIMRGMSGEADAKGILISLHVEINNSVREFYKALGFREKELRGIYYYMEREVKAVYQRAGLKSKMEV